LESFVSRCNGGVFEGFQYIIEGNIIYLEQWAYIHDSNTFWDYPVWINAHKTLMSVIDECKRLDIVANGMMMFNCDLYDTPEIRCVFVNNIATGSDSM
jgi:hypothetical protein